MNEAGAAMSGLRHVALGVVESTNDEAMNRAKSGADLPLWVTAEQQTVGRGRQGAIWSSEKGNLYASLALLVTAGHRLSDIPILASVALCDALAGKLGSDAAADLSIKWPNDLLFQGRKVAGILAESGSAGNDAVYAVTGFGVNLDNHPAGTRYPATDFSSEGFSFQPQDVFRALAGCMGEWLNRWQSCQKAGFAGIRDAWLARASSGLTRRIEVRLPRETLSGTFAGMDEKGRLILRQSDGGTQHISAGEVFYTDHDQVVNSDGQ